MSTHWRINLAPDNNGTVLITAPSLPELTSYADNQAQARERGLYALEEAFAARMARGEDIPHDSATNDHAGVTLLVKLPLLTELKIILYDACRGEGVTRAELARRLGWNRNSVDRLFKLDHASLLDQIEAAFEARGCTIDAGIVRTEAELARLREVA